MDIGREEIDRWHRDRGFNEIGYHLVFRRDGKVENGRGEDDGYADLDARGAGVLGHNDDSAHLCLVGGKHLVRSEWEFNYTENQLNALAVVCQALQMKYAGARVVGHRDLDERRECPGFDVGAWYSEQPKTIDMAHE